MKSSIRLAFSLFVLVVVLGGCWYPLFDLDVSIGEQFAQKLSPSVTFSGGYTGSYENEIESVLVFVPHRVPSALSGMLVLVNTDEEFLRYFSVQYDDILDELYLYSNYSEEYTVDTDLLGFSDDVNATTYFYTRTNIGDVAGIDSRFADGGSFTSISLPGSGIRIATGINPNDEFEDMLVVADWDNITGTLSIRGEPYGDGSAINTYTSPSVATGYDVPTYGVPKQGFIGQYPGNGDFVGSFIMEDGSIRNLRWAQTAGNASGAPTEFVGLDVLLTGILSNSQLYSQIDGTMKVYSDLGVYQYTIELGNVEFIQERFDTANAEWISVFTRTYVSNYEIFFEVFEIPTNNLEDLATYH